MRIGFNPQKDRELIPNDFFHQVIVPVYIPNQEGYFKDSFYILQYCLESIFKTSHSKTYITVVNNGSCIEVIDYLNNLFILGKIHELINSTNIGYVNAMLKGIVGHKFPLVTTTDADVLFMNNWQKETYKVFDAFPKAGVVCPTPSSKSLKVDTYNLFFDCLFSKKMKFTKVRNPTALENFAKSIGNPKFYNSHHLRKYLTVYNNKLNAVVGAGHFVVTYKGSIFNQLKEKYTGFALGGGSDAILDKPAVEQGYWRLSTEDNYTYHMGNSIEPWMLEKLRDIEDQSKMSLGLPILKEVKDSKLTNFVKANFFMRIIIRKPLWNHFLRYKGLTKIESNHY